MMAIYFMHYNFVRIHQTLEVTPAAHRWRHLQALAEASCRDAHAPVADSDMRRGTCADARGRDKGAPKLGLTDGSQRKSASTSGNFLVLED